MTGLIGALIVAVLLIPGVQLHPSEALAKDLPGSGPAIAGRQAIANAGLSPGVLKPFEILVEDNRRRRTAKVVHAVGATAGVDGGRADDLARSRRRGRGAVPLRGRRLQRDQTTISKPQHTAPPPSTNGPVSA